MKFFIVLAFAAIVYSANAKNLEKRDLRDDLLKRAAEIEARATAEIKKLEAANRTALAAGVQREEKYVQDLAAELKTATGPESIRVLEVELNLVEQRLTNELRALERGAMTKEELLAAAVKLETYIAEEVKKLQASGRNTAAATLHRESVRLQELSSALKSAESDLRIRVLEVELRLVETRVAEELRRLGFSTGTPSGTTVTTPSGSSPSRAPTTTAGTTRAPTTTAGTTRAPATTAGTTRKSIVKRDVRDDLLKRAADVEANATAEIKKLEAAGRSALAAGLKHEETRVQQIADELRNATGPQTIRLLEAELNFVENRLVSEVRALEREAQTREQLLSRAATLEANVAAEVKKLQAADRTQVAATLQREGQRLEQIAKELRNETSVLRINILEVELRLVETRVSEELRRLGFTTSSPSGTTGTTPSRAPVTTPTRNPTGSTPTGKPTVTTVGTTRKSTV